MNSTLSSRSTMSATSPFFCAPRILVVDDVTEDRLLLADFLRQRGYRLYVGENGRDAYDKSLIVMPDLILMDIRMPNSDGIVGCRLLKADERTRQIPVIFLSAAASPQERVAGLSEGAVDYVSKPFDFEEVRLRVAVHLGLTQQTQSQDLQADATTPPEEGQGLDQVLFRAARRLITQQLEHPLELADLAKAVGTNSRRLNEAFRQCAGVTVFDFLREERLKEARRLLSDTSLEIQLIASQLGYSSAANFSTAFRERFGVSPRNFRQNGEPIKA